LLDPQTGSRVTLLGQYLYVFGLLLFLQLDAHHLLLRLLADSFRFVPLNTTLITTKITWQIWQTFIGMFSLAFQIAAPLIVLLLASDLVLSLIARSVPQLNVFMVGFPLKAGLGILILNLMIPLFLTLFGYLLTVLERDMLTVMQILKP